MWKSILKNLGAVVVVVEGNSEVGRVVMVLGEGQQLSLPHFRGFNSPPSTRTHYATSTTFYAIPT